MRHQGAFLRSQMMFHASWMHWEFILMMQKYSFFQPGKPGPNLDSNENSTPSHCIETKTFLSISSNFPKSQIHCLGCDGGAGVVQRGHLGPCFW